MPRRVDCVAAKAGLLCVLAAACACGEPPAPPASSEAVPTAHDDAEDLAASPEVPVEPPPTPPVAEPEPSCRTLGEAGTATPVRSRRLQRYSSERYALDDVWDDLSMQRTRDVLRIRWWLPERDCRLATELVRVDDVVILREAPDPGSRCAVVGATLIETRLPLEAQDARVCVPGHDAPISLSDLERWADAPVPPRLGGRGVLDPWAE